MLCVNGSADGAAEAARALVVLGAAAAAWFAVGYQQITNQPHITIYFNAKYGML